MCGVAGIYAYSAQASASREELRAMRDHMASRGPDGFGEWFSDDGAVALGHRRLSIIDLSERSAQPMSSADGSLVLSYNGEIYNYRELRQQLEASGAQFRTTSDTEVLLHLYAQKGDAFLQDLRGMFAFALWDGVRGRMLLARDPFGIKPMYYAPGAGVLRFASQVKALLQAPVDRRPSAAGHTGFLLWGSVPEPWTLFEGIRALPAGHSLVATRDGVGTPAAFCRVRDVLQEAASAPARGTRSDALEAVVEALRESVVAHHVADVPVGVFLSAGLDSCMIASTAAGQGEAHTLTLGFQEFAGTADDEVPLAEEVARCLGTHQSTVVTKRSDFEDEREALLDAMDQPSIDGVNTWFVSRAAAGLNLEVALSGLGGDELFASYPSFRQVPSLQRLGRAFAGFPALGKGLRQLSAPILASFTSPKYAGLLEYGHSLGGAYLLRRCLFAPWELPGLLGAEFAAKGWADLHSAEQLDLTVQGIDQPRLAVSALEMSWYTRNQLLRDADWAGMAHSLEIRVPFLDIRLLRHAAPWFAAHPDITKAEVAAMAGPRLPKALLERPKTGFSVPVRDWIRPAGEAPVERGLRGWARFVHQRVGGATQ